MQGEDNKVETQAQEGLCTKEIMPVMIEASPPTVPIPETPSQKQTARPTSKKMSGSRPTSKGKSEDEDIPEFLSKYEQVYGRVKDYVLFEEIGRGMQGTVYKCLNLQDKKVYAIKSLDHSSLSKRRRKYGNNNSFNSLKNEIRIMKSLNHANLVKLYDVVDEPERDMLHLIMDYIHGGGVMNDSEIVSNPGPHLALPEDDARNMFGQAVVGLEFLHRNGILHRDIKPSNMLIDHNTNDGLPLVKVCDFGVSTMCNFEKSAKLLGEDDLIYGGMSGTIAMMCPEAIGGGPDHIYHGRPADVWAAGVSLFCMLFGTLPFRQPSGKSVEDLKKLILESSVVFPSKPKVSQEAKALILRMLDRDASTRVTLSLVREDPWFRGAFAKEPGLESVKSVGSASEDRSLSDSPTEPTMTSSSSSGGLFRSMFKALVHRDSSSSTKRSESMHSASSGSKPKIGWFSSSKGSSSSQ